MRCVIVGNGAAGIAAIREARALAPEAGITLVAPEEGPAYSRVLTSYYISGQVTRERLDLVDEGFYRRLRVETLFGREAAGLSPEENELRLSDGARLPFDRLLIASGGSAKRLGIPGDGLEGVFTLRNLADAEAIRRFVPGVKRAVVVGGGLVSFKAAEALLKLGLSVTFLISSDRVLSQILDSDTAGLVQRYLEHLGIRVLTGDDAAQIIGSGRVARVLTKNGLELPAEMVIVGKGVKPNIGWLSGSGVTVNRGVVVDDYLHSSRPGVFAAGDAAEAYDRVRQEKRINALWGNAVEQGTLAGRNMVAPEGEGAKYPGSLSENSLHWGELSVITIGVINPPANDPHYLVLGRRRGDAFFRRLVLHDGKLVGAVLYGDVRGAGILRAMILAPREGEAARQVVWEDLLEPGLNYARVYRRLAGNIQD